MLFPLHDLTPPQYSKHGNTGYREVDAHDTADRPTNHHGKYGEQWMNLEFVSHDAGRNPVVHEYPPKTDKGGHPNPVSVRHRADADYCYGRNHPARDGDKLKNPGEEAEGEKMRETEQESSEGEEDEREYRQGHFCPYVVTQHGIQFASERLELL